MSMKNSNDTIGNRTHNLPTCSAVRKSVTITYSEFAFVVLGIQHAMHMRHIVIRRLSGSTLYFYTIL